MAPWLYACFISLTNKIVPGCGLGLGSSSSDKFTIMLSVKTVIVTIMTKFGVHINTFTVAGAAKIGEQVASEQATCRGYYSCCTVLLLYCSLLHYKSVMSGFLSTWVGLFLGERVLKNTITPSLGSHLSSSPMGIFSRDFWYYDSLRTSFSLQWLKCMYVSRSNLLHNV